MKLRALFRSALLLIAATVCSLSAKADLAPEFINPTPGTSTIFIGLSDNGKWAVAETASTTDGDIRPRGGTLLNLETMTTVKISHPSGLAGVSDVTDDGQIVAGECNTKPAYWKASSKSWTILPLPAGFATGRINAITPDGRYGAGYVNLADDEFAAQPVLYDLTTNSLIDLPGLPTKDQQNEDKKQNYFSAISADGRYLYGHISVSYLLPVSPVCYVYDTVNHTYNIIGFTETPNKTPWTPLYTGMHFTEPGSMSPDGHWITGAVYMVKNNADSEWPTEYRTGFRYNVWDNTFELYDETTDIDIAGFNVADDGTVLGVTPALYPWASMMVRKDKYYYDFGQILKQAYGIDFESATGHEVTGKPLCVSADGRTIIMMPDTENSYILRLKESLTEACDKVDLLGNYTVTPAPGTSFTSISTVRLVFDRPVESGYYGDIKLLDSNGNTVRSALRCDADGMTVSISFRTTTLDAGKKYTVAIPAGHINIKGDKSVKSREINISYIGRGTAPVALTESYPADNAAVAGIDVTANPLLLTFDANVKVAEGARGYLYRATEDNPYCELSLGANENRVLVYPLSAQRFYNGTNYKVVIPANSITDLSGTGGNEEIVLHFEGTYVRQISADDRYLFNEDCTSYDNFMFYEGDNRVPDAIPSGWGFTQSQTPWMVLRESVTASDMCFCSHSMYIPAGQADDWVTTPQIYIPDDRCFLSFKSQSYMKSKKDYLKVIAYVSDNVYNSLSKDIIDDIRANGEVIYNELQSPGKSEEDLEGDWTDNKVKLDKFAGKNVYICFVNENDDQSAIMIDDIQIVHDMKFLTSFETPTRVVNRDEIVIKGTITVASDIDTYSNVELTLTDGEGNTAGHISEGSLSLKHNDVYPFEFSTPLPLKRGVENNYTVTVTLDNETSTINNSVKNLTFEPVKRVVVEEFAGSSCKNCPLGILAMQNLEKSFPGLIIPIVIRTYQSDVLGTGMAPYSSFLGLSAAPSGRVNRTEVSMPMVSVGANDYRFSGAGLADSETQQPIKLWYDYAAAELAQAAEADITFSSSYDAASRNISIDCNVRSAINATRQNINLFAVILEDNLVSYQENNLGSVDCPALGEWGKGGAYATSLVYPYTFNDVARGCVGTTFNGTGGLLPTTLSSDEVYPARLQCTLPESVNDAANTRIAVMMIDANTNRVINANVARLGEETPSGIDAIEVDGDAGGAGASAVAFDGSVIVNAAEDVDVTVYTLSGIALASASGNGLVSVDLNGYHGLVIVRMATASGVSVEKLVVR